jgi:hypothetical protein
VSDHGTKTVPATATATIPPHLFQQSLKAYPANNFIHYLTNLFGEEITSTLITKYFIGTSKHWNGSTVFWQIDKDKKIRTGKIMLYNSTTGKRVKQPFNHITWVHTLLNKNRHCEPRPLGGEAISPFEPSLTAVPPQHSAPNTQHFRTCLFGEHLISDTTKPIAIVESEKTAIIASIYLPNFIWLACGSLTNLTKEKCQVLSGRKVILYPDLKCFEKWSAKASELSSITNFTVSDFLEKKATDTDKQSGLDLADYLIRFNHSAFVTPISPLCEPANAQARGAGGVSFLQKIISQAPTILDHFELSTPKPFPPLCAPAIAPERGAGPACNSGRGVSSCHPEPIEGRANPIKSSALLPLWGQGGWTTTIQDLESFFTSTQLPSEPIKVNNHSTITDVNKFIEAHLLTVKFNNGNRYFEPYLLRLIELRNILRVDE